MKSTYSIDLMKLGRLTYGNLVDDGSWASIKQKVENKQEKNFIILATEILQQASNTSSDGNTRIPEDPDRSGGTRNYQNWRYENPDGAKTKVVEGITMIWCTNDCHQKPMWCGRRNYLPKAEFAQQMQKKHEKISKKECVGSEKAPGFRVNEEFKVALAALATTEDYAILDKQFF